MPPSLDFTTILRNSSSEWRSVRAVRSTVTISPLVEPMAEM